MSKVICDFEIENEKWQELDNLDELKHMGQKILESALSETPFHKKNPQVKCEISINLTGNELIQKLNYESRGKNKATNVLSFPCLDPKTFNNDVNCEILAIGEIFLSFEIIQAEATEQGKKFSDHFYHLLTHGFLHLLGFDHEETEEAEIMENLEVKILTKFNIRSPY